MPEGAFTSINGNACHSEVGCVASCKPNNGCNAVIFGPNSCQRGALNLSYVATTPSEPMVNFYVEEGKSKVINAFLKISLK